MFRRYSRFLATGFALVFAFLLMSCGSGGNYSDTAEVFAVEVSDNGSTATMEVFFNLSDGGAALAGVDAGSIRFAVAKLLPAASPRSWVSYINSLETVEAGDPGPNPVGATAAQATTERASTTGGVFTDNGDGTYSYKFSINFRAVADPVTVIWQPSLTHRIAMQVSGNVTNAVYDFIPSNQNATPDTRNIVANTACSECHERLGLHGGDRVAIKYCVTCHNPGSEDAHSGNTVDFKVMVHKIHRGADLPAVEDGGEYAIWGYRNSKHDYSKGVFPQSINNCTKCHDNTNAATPEADNWKNVPSVEACTACHDAQDPVEYPTFPDLTAAQIETAHVTPNASPHNLNLPAGVPNIEYVLNSATVDGNNQAVINFQILRDGVAMDLFNRGSDLSGWPDLYLAYALPQDGITTPAEYNNLGEPQGQRLNVDIDQLGPVNNNDGTMVDNGDGTYTATTGGTTYANGAFPAGATLRAVGMAGYMHVDVSGTDYSLHTPSQVVAVTGDTARREVVDNNKCANCHEWLQLHGGSRTFDTRICAFCHVPNLSSSGREIAVPNARVAPAAATFDVTLTDDALTFPEATNNLKDMIHGIHGGEERTTDYQFVRNRNNGYYYNWSEVVFPGNSNNCLTCHKPGTYTVPLVDDTLLTTNRTTGVADGQDATVDDVTTAEESVPNDTDFVITPTAAACYSCHDGELNQAHMEQNGAAINNNRSVVLAASPVETCSLCHGTGQIGDLEVAHATTEATVIASITTPDSSNTDLSQVDLFAPGPISAQPAGHTDNLSCGSCHSPD